MPPIPPPPGIGGIAGPPFLGVSATIASVVTRRAETEAQLVGYDRGSGIVRYDQDGAGGQGAVKVAILDNSPNYVDFHDFIVVT